jgi:AcrR family transcriptional regulator
MPPKKGSANRRGAARREEILDAAVELFATRGYRGSGILELADRVGMSHAGILHHFGTKENLLRAVVARRDAVQDENISGLVERGVVSARPTPREPGTYVEPTILTRLVTVLRTENLDPGDPLHDYFVDRQRYVHQLAVAELRAAQERGEIRADVDLDTTAFEILAFTTGIETMWLLDPDAIDIQRVTTTFWQTLIDDLTRADAPRNRRR